MDEQNAKTKFTKGKVLVDQDLINKSIDTNVQHMINKPQADPTGVEDKDANFMKLVVGYINEGKIDLHTPATLMNRPVYDKLDEKAQGKADFNAIALLNDLHQMKKLYDSGDHTSFQIQNLVQRVRLTKERLENECGDIYII
ncbi:hypothetical protein KKD70_00625 [Patescibacteria group bacterium]|nr:hypothetical protein [Patescibacteria group bacterium]